MWKAVKLTELFLLLFPYYNINITYFEIFKINVYSIIIGIFIFI